VDYRFFIARRYLASRHHASLISVITGISVAGVALGVAALIVVLSVMNGFYDFVQGLLVSLDPHVRVVSAEGRGLTDADSLRRVTLRTEHVTEAAPYVQGKALLAPEEDSQANKVVIVRGADSSALRGVSQVVEETGFGTFSLERKDGRPGLVMGMSLGRRFGLLPAGGTAAASTVGLLSAPALEQMLTRVFGAPPVYRFEVRGLYEMQAVYDQSHVFVDLQEAQRLFNMGNRVTGIDLRIDDLNRAGAVKRNLQQQLPARYTVQTWYDLQQSLYDMMRLEKWGAWAILMLIIVVAAFNIVGSLTMVVIEKRRDVGVLQAMGVSPQNIRRIFLTEGLLIGGVGTGAGFALGLGLALAQKHYGLVPMAGAESFLLDAYPVAVRATDLAVIGGVAMALCALAALYPAFRASSVAPARAVQME
jgi:lipoprotein-releasing system permease protein